MSYILCLNIWETIYFYPNTCCFFILSNSILIKNVGIKMICTLNIILNKKQTKLNLQ